MEAYGDEKAIRVENMFLDFLKALQGWGTSDGSERVEHHVHRLLACHALQRHSPEGHRWWVLEVSCWNFNFTSNWDFIIYFFKILSWLGIIATTIDSSHTWRMPARGSWWSRIPRLLRRRMITPTRTSLFPSLTFPSSNGTLFHFINSTCISLVLDIRNKILII